jgi:hypothetical protein
MLLQMRKRRHDHPAAGTGSGDVPSIALVLGAWRGRWGPAMEKALAAMEEALAAMGELLVAAGGGQGDGGGDRGGTGGGMEKSLARERKKESAIDILRSRFSSVAYISQTNKANDLSHWITEKWLSELPAPHANGPTCHRRSHQTKKCKKE